MSSDQPASSVQSILERLKALQEQHASQRVATQDQALPPPPQVPQSQNQGKHYIHSPHPQHALGPLSSNLNTVSHPHGQTYSTVSTLPPAVQPFPAKVLIDPATIIDWPAGLICIMRTVAKHEKVLQDIRKMIRIGHENEQNWFKGRQELLLKQAARKENQKKLDEVLKSIGGAPTSGASNVSPEELAKELQTFDMKVHKAQIHMFTEFSARLKALGVPFFGTKPELIRKAKREERNEFGSTTPTHEPEDEMRTIDEVELLKLQRKMLETLEDLSSEG